MEVAAVGRSAAEKKKQWGALLRRSHAPPVMLVVEGGERAAQRAAGSGHVEQARAWKDRCSRNERCYIGGRAVI